MSGKPLSSRRPGGHSRRPQPPPEHSRPSPSRVAVPPPPKRTYKGIPRSIRRAGVASPQTPNAFRAGHPSIRISPDSGFILTNGYSCRSALGESTPSSCRRPAEAGGNYHNYVQRILYTRAASPSTQKNPRRQPVSDGERALPAFAEALHTPGKKLRVTELCGLSQPVVCRPILTRHRRPKPVAATVGQCTNRRHKVTKVRMLDIPRSGVRRCCPHWRTRAFPEVAHWAANCTLEQ
jgi:hypothetical protein